MEVTLTTDDGSVETFTDVHEVEATSSDVLVKVRVNKEDQNYAVTRNKSFEGATINVIREE